ncbi:MAG: PLP-dependent aminotransferase family protein [Elainella sp. C42_A2020_010]|nr:PLP-dependent aminotransferase family protein [Elainella sp. C42_A2020_010]
MLWLPIDRNSSTPLIRQIYLELRQQILQGTLAAGQKLPATRALATQLGVSRNVVLEAYDQLIAEGYLESRAGSGTYVAQGATWSVLPSQPRSEPASEPDSADWIDFRSGIPDLDRVPSKLWGQITKQVGGAAAAEVFGYGSPEGRLELRSTLAAYLQRTRGVICQPDQIIITSGAAQAFGLVAKLLAAPGDTVVLEDPTPPEIRHIFAAQGLTVQAVSVDERGLQTEKLSAVPGTRFVLVTPSHQFPLGSVLTIQRRIELLEFARTTGCTVVEDDYDSEFRYEGTPVSSLQGLDPERVIYIGTFSKILAPALRLGYLVLPPAYVAACRELKRLSDLHTSSLEQITLAQFIQAGHLERHIARMRKLYRQRRNVLRHSLLENFSDCVKILGDSTGLHLVAEFKHIEFTVEVMQRIKQKYVKVYPVLNYAIDPNQHSQKVVLGYGNLSTDAIQTGIARLNQAIYSTASTIQ